METLRKRIAGFTFYLCTVMHFHDNEQIQFTLIFLQDSLDKLHEPLQRECQLFFDLKLIQLKVPHVHSRLNCLIYNR